MAVPGWFPQPSGIPPITTTDAAAADGPEIRCTMYRPTYCAGDMALWSKRSEEINKEHCAKCSRRDVPEERTRGW